MTADRRCPHCASDTPGRHYRDLCPGDATLRPLGAKALPVPMSDDEKRLRAMRGLR